MLTYFKVNFFAALDASFNKFLLRLFCVCKYDDAEFLILFVKTSANNLEMQYFLHINGKIDWWFINGDSNRFLIKFLPVLFGIWFSQYCFCLFRCYFLFKFCYFFTVANTFSFHSLHFEVICLVLSAIASILVSRSLVISNKASEKIILWGSL